MLVNSPFALATAAKQGIVVILNAIKEIKPGIPIPVASIIVTTCELLGNWITKHRFCDGKPSLLRAVPAQYCYLFVGYTDTFITLGFDNPLIGIVIDKHGK